MTRTHSPKRTIPTNLFSYKNGLFTAEISTLRGYPVSAKIVLVNPKTGGQIDFDLVTIDRDREGETAGWNYESKSGEHAGLRVLIIND